MFFCFATPLFVAWEKIWHFSRHENVLQHVLGAFRILWEFLNSNATVVWWRTLSRDQHRLTCSNTSLSDLFPETREWWVELKGRVCVCVSVSGRGGNILSSLQLCIICNILAVFLLSLPAASQADVTDRHVPTWRGEGRLQWLLQLSVWSWHHQVRLTPSAMIKMCT